MKVVDHEGQLFERGASMKFLLVCVLVACGGNNTGNSDGPNNGSGDGPTGDGPMLGPCPMLPANNIFNTRIDGLPPDPNSDTYVNTTIGGTRKLHLDLGTDR